VKANAIKCRPVTYTHLRGTWYMYGCRYPQKKPDCVKGKGVKKKMSKYSILHTYLVAV